MSLNLDEYVKDNILNLNGLKLNDEDADNILLYLENHPSLTVLSLEKTNVSDSFGVILAQKIKLHTLDLTNTKISSITAKELSKNQYIRFLKTGFNNIEEEGIIAIATNTNNIERLDIPYCGAGLKSAIALSKNEKITHLNLGNNIDWLVHSIPEEAETIELNMLYSEKRNQIGDEGAKYLALSKSIISLNVNTNGIGAAGINEFIKNNLLIELNISNIQKIDEYAIALFLQHHNIPNPERFIFSEKTHNKVSEDDIILLAEHTFLQMLDLRSHNLTEKSCAALAANTQLKKLYLSPGQFESNKALWFMSESNPLKRANNARNSGVNAEVPSLLRLSIFAASQTNYSESEAYLPKELVDALNCADGLFDALDSERKMNIYGL